MIGQKRQADDTTENAAHAGAVLACTGLNLGYGSLPAVTGLDLAVRPGQIVTVLGANGAGKTTTLLGLAGAIRPFSGQVWLSGRQVSGPLHQRAKQGLALVPEERSVIYGLSVRDNLAIGRGGIEPALELFPELKPLLKQRAGLLSGGEQQILTLARALAAQPRVLLADELSLGLAPKIVDRLLQALREAADGGVAMIIVEQQIRRILAYADYAYVMRRGSVVMEGSAAEIRDRIDEVEAQYLSTADDPVARNVQQPDAGRKDRNQFMTNSNPTRAN
ncbi:ABC transporter ATP-binding protein [Rhodococcoides fascians]|uniref:ABC transporter ATP-binding protein n=1 Tax=Rhodococcoides fascians TaxID=1828 RepID=UPI0009B89CAC|nr:ABC transporter ATP-binding protein [Rhodococcus fascians]